MKILGLDVTGGHMYAEYRNRRGELVGITHLNPAGPLNLYCIVRGQMKCFPLASMPEAAALIHENEAEPLGDHLKCACTVYRREGTCYRRHKHQM